MIAANDLRIGNWVQLTDAWYKNHPQYYNEPKMQKVKTFNCDYLLKTHYINSYDLSDLEPIPLTEKILLDCGFYIDETKNASRMLPNNEVLILELNDKGIYTDYAYGTEIEYLHNLQNLHKELSKTELIINL